jgi:hypothetical protein
LAITNVFEPSLCVLRYIAFLVDQLNPGKDHHTSSSSSTTLTDTMAFDLWTHQFCLACDKQTDGATYCSESCRLADFEKTSSTPSSGASSPGFAVPSYPWTTPRQPAAKFYLSPAYDFSNAQPYGSTPTTTSFTAGQQRPHSNSSSASLAAPAVRSLTPSSSYSSLCSMQSAASADSTALSDKARKELRAYAVSFEQVRLQRRRSY